MKVTNVSALRRLFALVATSALLLAACGEGTTKVAVPDPAKDPKGALSAALKNTKGAKSVTLSFASDPASLTILSAMGEGEPLTPEQAQMILDSSITFASNGEQDPKKVTFELAANIAGIENAFELKFLNDTLYMRGDVRGLADKFAPDPDRIDDFVAEAPEGFEWLDAAVEGEWLSVAGISTLMEQFAPPGAMATPDPEEAKKLQDQILKILEDSSTATSEGTDEVGDHIVTSIEIRPVVEGFMQALSALGTMPPGFEEGFAQGMNEIPDEEIVGDVWIADDSIAQLELDLLQFATWGGEEAPTGVDQAALRLTIEDLTSEIEAPEEATPISPADLMKGFMAQPGSEMTGGSTVEEIEVEPEAEGAN
jgi:hypothetical protein